jgi:hypothetical protein
MCIPEIACVALVNLTREAVSAEERGLRVSPGRGSRAFVAAESEGPP